MLKMPYLFSCLGCTLRFSPVESQTLLPPFILLGFPQHHRAPAAPFQSLPDSLTIDDGAMDDEKVRSIASIVGQESLGSLRLIQQNIAERRFRELAGRLDAQDSASSSIKDDIAALAARFSKAESNIAIQDARSSGIEGDVATHVAALAARISEVEGDSLARDTRCSKIEGDITAHAATQDTRVSGVESDIATRFSQVQDDIAIICHQVAQHGRRLEELQRISTTLEDLASRISPCPVSSEEIHEIRVTVSNLPSTLATLQDTIVSSMDLKAEGLFQKLESDIATRLENCK